MMTVTFVSLLVIPAFFIELVLGIVMILGAVQMLRLKSHGLAMVASFMALWPCSPACLLGLPMGIWALIVLGKPEVKRAFQVAALQPVRVPDPPPGDRTPDDRPPDDWTPDTRGTHMFGGVFQAGLALGVMVCILLLAPWMWRLLTEEHSTVRPATSRPVSSRPATSPTQGTPGETWVSDHTNSHFVYFQGPQAPQVSDLLATRLDLRPGQHAGLAAAFQRFHERFLALEFQHTQKTIDKDGHQISQVESFGEVLTTLEEQFWMELESTLTGGQLTKARKILRLRGGMYTSGDNGLRVEIWKVGKIDPWFHWRVSYPDQGRVPPREPKTLSGPQLPEQYRRFWAEPEAQESTPEAQPQ